MPNAAPPGSAQPINNLGIAEVGVVGSEAHRLNIPQEIILNTPPAGEFVTIITSVEGKRLTKRVERNANGSFKIIDYDEGATWFRFEYVEIADLAALAQAIAGLTKEQAIVPGRICDGADPSRARRLAYAQEDGTPATLQDHPHRWLVCDIDKIPAADADGEFDPVAEPERAARYVRSKMPPVFHDAVVYYQLSSSAGFKRKNGKPTINMKLFFVLSRALTAAEQKAWLDPYIKESPLKKVKVKGERAILDGAMYQPERLIYLAKPNLADDVVDPVPQRSGIIDGAVVQVPEPDAMRPDGTGKVFEIKPEIPAAEGPPAHEIVWDDPDTIAWAQRVIAEELAENGKPLDGEDTYSDNRAYELVGKLKDGRARGTSVKPDTIAMLLKQHWAPHFEIAWLVKKVNGKHRNTPGCGPYGSASRQFATLEPTHRTMASGGEVIHTFHGSQDHLAIEFSTGRNGQLAYVDEWSAWQAFDGQRWVKVPLPKIWNAIMPYARAASAGMAPTQRNAMLSRGNVSGVEALARGHLIVAAEAFDAQAWALNTPAGVVDLHTGELHRSAPEAYCTKMTKVAPGGDCPRWRQFLEEITGGDKELQAYLKRLIGCSLVGEVIEHVLAFLYGTGGNGKGVFLNTITGLLGDYV
jgi:hypothetical protein